MVNTRILAHTVLPQPLPVPECARKDCQRIFLRGAYAEKYYSTDHDVKILYAGPNWGNGYQSYSWYVIAEIRASSHVNGSEMRHNGCDAPGLAYLQTRDGWVYIPDGAFPGFIGFWMGLFNMAGEGQPTPATDLLPDETFWFCNSHEMIWYGR